MKIYQPFAVAIDTSGPETIWEVLDSPPDYRGTYRMIFRTPFQELADELVTMLTITGQL